MARKTDLPKETEKGVSLKLTKDFLKKIRKQSLEEIAKAIEKIGTGLGYEHTLTTGHQAIRTNHGGRIIFKYQDSQNATLLTYTSNHDYDKALRGLIQ